MKTIVKMLNNEINNDKRADSIQNCEEALSENPVETSKTFAFYQLPLQNIFSVISKIDFFQIDDIVNVMQNFIKNTVRAHKEEKESLFLLQVFNTKDHYFKLEECVKLLSSFINVDLCVKLGSTFDYEYHQPEVDTEFEKRQKEEEIEALKRRLICETKFPSIKERPIDFQYDIFNACQEGKLESVQYILECEGVNKDLKNKYGQTPLHIACIYGQKIIVEYLLEKAMANKEAVNGIGWTPLFSASSGGHLNIVEYLIDTAHVLKHPYDKSGRTPLHISCSNGFYPLVEYFINELGYDINEADKEGRTPLHIAVSQEYTDIVQFLISSGADKTLRDNNNHLPIDLTYNEHIRNILSSE